MRYTISRDGVHMIRLWNKKSTIEKWKKENNVYGTIVKVPKGYIRNHKRGRWVKPSKK